MVLMAWAALIVLLPCWGLRSAEGQPTSTDSGMSTIRKNILLILTVSVKLFNTHADCHSAAKKHFALAKMR